jgi:NTE family protein
MSRTGLVLGGGGIVGQAYHGAVLAGIEAATGWDPREAEVVVGTSAGSASGAGTPFSREGQGLLVALGPPPQVRPVEVDVDADRVRAAFRRLALRSQLDPGSVPPGVLTSVAMSPGNISAAWLTRQVEWLNGGTNWPERGFWSCAVDLDDGSRVVFGRPGEPPAEPGQAVAASCAIPGVFAPVEINGRLYIDGGGWSPTNADVLADLGLDLVIVVSPMSDVPGCGLERRDFMVRRACRSLLMREAAAVRASGTPVVVVEPVAADLGVMGRLIGIDVLDEGRCDAVVEQVTASTVARVRDGSIAGFGKLPVAQLLAA